MTSAKSRLVLAAEFFQHTQVMGLHVHSERHASSEGPPIWNAPAWAGLVNLFFCIEHENGSAASGPPRSFRSYRVSLDGFLELETAMHQDPT